MSTATPPTRTYGSAIPADRTPEQWRERLGEFEQACEHAETQLTIAKANAKEAKEEFDGAVAILRAALREFTHGTTDRRPLLDLAEQEPEAETGFCDSTYERFVCCLFKGHEGNHEATGDHNEVLETWTQPVVEQAALTLPRRKRKAPPGVEEETLANA